MAASIERIIIRHLSGSKANQIEQLPAGDLREISIGRDPTSKVAFDPVGDSVVSRKHAVIRIEGDGDAIKFKLTDAGSSNGTFLNGERISGEVELLPDDKIELGSKGPKFSFDVQPRPANFAARTQVIGVTDAAATRVIKTAETAASTALEAAATGANNAAEGSSPSTGPSPGKIGVGQETVQRLIGEERGKANRTMTGAIAAVVAFFVLGGAALYWKQRSEISAQDAEAKLARSETEEKLGRIPEDVSRKIGMKAMDIYNNYAKSTVQIFGAWRLYDKQTGKPLLQKKVPCPGKGTCPAFVKLPGAHGVVRWLTLDDNNISNASIGVEFTGSGFVVGEHGYIMTNKHVGAPWQVVYDMDTEGVLFEYVPSATKKYRLKPIGDFGQGSSDYSKIRDWIPESGGYIFKSDVPTVLTGNTPDPTTREKESFVGRFDYLEAKFHESSLGNNASLIRASPEADVALLKIDTPQTLAKINIAEDDAVTIGESVIVLGYPAISVRNAVARRTEEAGRIRTQLDIISEATVTEGIISKLATGVKETEGKTFASDIGDAMQLSINSTGSGNSGGPVFDAKGRVIGLFTYGRQSGGINVTMAVPIKYGRELLLAQKQ